MALSLISFYYDPMTTSFGILNERVNLNLL